MDGTRIVTQGFPAFDGEGSYVFVGIEYPGGELGDGIVLSPEGANVLGEYLRQEAEAAANKGDLNE